MWRTLGITFWTSLALTLSGCGGGYSALPSPTPSPSPSPTPSSGSVTITAISPTSAPAGSPDLTLTITGSNLEGRTHNIRRAVWSVIGSTTNLATTSVSNTQLSAVAPAPLLSTPLTAQIFIEYGDPMGDVPLGKSNSIAFSVMSGATPSVVPATDTLRVNGTRQFVAAGFDNNSAVNWSVEEGSAGGTITSDGYYTAPANTGAFHVIAASVSDANKNAAALVTVTNAGFAPSGMMHVPRTGHTATLLNDGRVLIVGGGDATAELFDPASGIFSFTASPVAGRLGATATLLSDGRVLIAGGLGLTAGSDGYLALLTAGEIFDPATGTFSSTGTMLQARRQHTATRLMDGRVLVTGGPASGVLSPTGALGTARVGHTATLLHDGRVLVTGGTDANGNALATAELYK